MSAIKDLLNMDEEAICPQLCNYVYSFIYCSFNTRFAFVFVFMTPDVNMNQNYTPLEWEKTHF